MDRIDLATLDHRVTRAWKSSGGAEVRVGTAGEQHFAWHSRKGLAWISVFERSTASLADQWLARGAWRRVAATDETLNA